MLPREILNRSSSVSDDYQTRHSCEKIFNIPVFITVREQLDLLFGELNEVGETNGRVASRSINRAIWP